MGCGAKLGCLAFIAGLALIWGGGQGVYTAITNRQPTEISYEEFLKNRPDAEWLHLKNCTLDIPDSAYPKTSGKLARMYVPLRSPGEKGANDKPIQVILSTTDPEIRRLGDQMNTMPQDDETAVMKFMLTNMDKLYPTKDVKGLVQFGLEVDSETHDQLKSVYGSTLARDFVVLEHNAEPELGLSLILLIVGVVLAGGVIAIAAFSSGGKDETEGAGEPGAEPPIGETTPQQDPKAE